MKWIVLLPIVVEADPADFRDAAQKAFEALAEMISNEEEVKLHLLPQDGSDEAEIGAAVLSSTFCAQATLSFY